MKPHRVAPTLHDSPSPDLITTPGLASWRRLHPVGSQSWARLVTARLIRQGKVRPRPDACERCGSPGAPGVIATIQAHHRDYRHPADIEYLCGRCHWQADEARRALERAS